MSRQNTWTPPDLLTSPQLAHAVIGAWMKGCRASDAPFLKPEHFHDERDQALWAAVLSLESEGVACDATALVERVKRTSRLGDTDWLDYCAGVRREGLNSSGSSMATHARTIYENWRRLQSYRHHLKQAQLAADLSVPLPAEERAPAGGASSQPRKRWSVAELLEAQFPEPHGPWPGIIPAGLTVIGARPKFGKSLLMLQVSAAVGSGGMLFGQSVEQAPVLYYALEDSPKRLKERIGRLGITAQTRIDFARVIQPLHLGGLADVEAAAQDYGLIVLDTISRAVPGQDLNREAALFGDLLGRLQSMALDHNISIVAVVHTRKPNGMDHDPIDDVLGSTQMTAAADCVLAIYRDAARHSLLKGRARDMEDIDLTMEFDPATICWQVVGQTAEVAQSENEAEVLEALRELGRAKASAVAKAIGKDRGNTSRRLARLAAEGQCLMESVKNQIYYYLEPDEH